MTGQLREHPLAELLHEIFAAGLSGALRLEYERLKIVVYLADGELIYAASNLRQQRLSECLQRWKVLPAQALQALPMGASDQDFARALIEAGTLNRESLEPLQARQVTEVLRPAVLWIQGLWEFDARVRINKTLRVHFDVRGLLMEGARRLPAEFVASRFTDPYEKLTPAKNAAASPELLPTEAFVLSRIDGPLSLAELIAITTLPEKETKQIVYTLALGGILERDRWSRAFSAEMLERARNISSAPKRGARTATSGQQDREAGSATPANASTAEVGELLEPADLFARLALARNHYQVLGVVSSASLGDIKGSYHKLAKRFHPDRFHTDADATLHARIEEAFARIAQAYETLKDKQTRAAYDLKLSQQGADALPAEIVGSQPQVVAKPGEQGEAAEESPAVAAAHAAATLLRQAEESFNRGMLALRQLKQAVAIASLAEAARLVPQEARYRAYYGLALSENEGMRRQAESELKAAIALDANNAGYHVMLAEFYLKHGLPRRSRSEAERALAIDPQNAAARRLLDQLQATLKGQR